MSESRIRSRQKIVQENIWVCQKCKLVFAFPSDVKAHMVLTGHADIRKYDLPQPNSFRDAEHE